MNNRTKALHSLCLGERGRGGRDQHLEQEDRLTSWVKLRLLFSKWVNTIFWPWTYILKFGSIVCILFVCVQLCPTLCNPMGCSHQAPLSMGFSQQEHWSGLSFPPPGDIPNPGIKPTSPSSPELAGNFFTI